jgi:uncharacterized membrane protein YdbT with pleckstrin-like domain
LSPPAGRNTIGANVTYEPEERVSERSSIPQSTEQTVWQGSPSQAVNLPVYLLLGLGVVVATIALLFLRGNTLPSATDELNPRSVYPWIIVAIWVICGIGALTTYLKVSTTKYVLTTERLRVTTGILSTVTEDLELRRVRDSVILRPFWARLAGLGDVQILSADASTPRMVLHAIKDPDGVQTKIRSIVQTQWAKFNVRQMEID